MAAEASADSSNPDAVLESVKQIAKDAYEDAYYNGPAGSDYEPSNAALCLSLGDDINAFSYLDV